MTKKLLLAGVALGALRIIGRQPQSPEPRNAYEPNPFLAALALIDFPEPHP